MQCKTCLSIDLAIFMSHSVNRYFTKGEKKMKKGKLFLILMCLAVIFFPACQGESTTPDTNGSIRVVINDSTGLSGGAKPEG